MKDLALNSSGDLDVSAHALHLLDGAPRVAQQIGIVLRGFSGEWEFDLDWGVPWYQRILGVKPVNLNDAEDALKKKILAVADVKSILSFKMDFDRQSRTWSIIGSVNTTFGTVQTEGVFP